MRRPLWRPAILLLCVAGAVFALAQGRFLAPAAPTGSPIATGDVYHGEIVFEATCAGCHGTGGVGGGVGPRLAGAGLSATLVQSRVEQGAGVMPARLVENADEADVVTYVLGITAK